MTVESLLRKLAISNSAIAMIAPVAASSRGAPNEFLYTCNSRSKGGQIITCSRQQIFSFYESLENKNFLWSQDSASKFVD